MNKTQKGFAALEALLILILVAIIGGTGYYVWHSQKQTDKTSTDTLKASQSSTNVKTENNRDTELIADAIATKCQTMDASIDQAKLKSDLLKTYNGSNSPLNISGNYAHTGASCDVSSPGGFAVWLKKNNGGWNIVSQGQQPPTCDLVDYQGWPKDILALCFDSSIQDNRAPK
jgi:uncharacterized protein (UPF0333 family)